MASASFVELSDAINTLRNHLLPSVFGPTGSYPQEVETRTLAFKVLVHAEIEDYLESRATEVADRAVDALISRGLPTKTTLSLVAFSGLKFELVAEMAMISFAVGNPDPWMERVRRAKEAYLDCVKKNNGVRRKDVLALLIPIGVSLSDLDDVWLSTADTFGSERGTVAHNSGRKARARKFPDSTTEDDAVQFLLAGLADIDLLFDQLLV